MHKEDWQERGKGHRERLRRKFREGGLERFSDEEVVEFLLTLGTPRGDQKLPAREALKQFGSLSGVLSAPVEKLTGILKEPDKFRGLRKRLSDSMLRFSWERQICGYDKALTELAECRR